jgi:hypothetical protein
MENKKYLDKVVGSLVRSTKIDYEKELVYTPPFFHLYTALSPHLFIIHLPSSLPSFRLYCKNQFGLTEEEMEYVWKEYVDIMLEKINQ